MRGDPVVLTHEYAKKFCLYEAMDKAGYKGRGRIYEAVRDIEEHAHILRRSLGGESDLTEYRRQRILDEYARIAFSEGDENIRTSDKLKALELYRILSDIGGGDNASLVVNYDYGDEE